MIGKFLSSLSDNGKKILIVAVVIIFIALFDRLLIDPTLSKLSSIDQEIAKEENNIKQDLHFLGYKTKIIKEDQTLEPYVTVKLLAEEEIIAAFLKKIEGIAVKANVAIVKITPALGVKEKEYLKYQADLECSGKLVDVITFMHLIGNADELMKVLKFNLLSKKADSDDLKATMTVEKIIVAKHAASS